MPQIFIPPLGTVIQLEQDWHFTLHAEGRNDRLIEESGITPPFRDPTAPYSGHLQSWRETSLKDREAAIALTKWEYTPYPGMEADHEYSYWSGNWKHPFVFREGTELKVGRIYIRQGGQEFDSVTFSSKQWVSAVGDPLFTASRKLKTIRFWAKLADVNNMVGRMIDD